jgi:hypothetical protein
MSVQSPNSGAVYASWNDEASAGANQIAASQIAQRLGTMRKVVAILPDRGGSETYLPGDSLSK